MLENQSLPMEGVIDMNGLGAVMTNLTLITDILKPYNLTLPDYLALTGGFPTEPLALPPKHMDIAEYKEIAEALFADVQQARDSEDSNAINQAFNQMASSSLQRTPPPNSGLSSASSSNNDAN